MQDAGTECSLLGVQFTNRLPTQFALETPTLSLVQGTSVYTLPNRTAAIGLVYLTVGVGGSDPFDIPLMPMSAQDYGAIPNKTTQGRPTTYHFQLLPVPTITFWPTPDSGGPYQANVQSFRQTMDLSISGGQTIDAPFRFLDAFVAGLAARLARNWAPALYPQRKADWEEAWSECTQFDQPPDNLYIICGLDSYTR